MLFETHPVKLRDLVDQARSGRIQLPDFQRPWVWDDERIAALLATVARGYPLGVMMTMETDNAELQFRPKPLVGAELKGPVMPEELLMDGQQRLTSLSQALASDKPVDTMDTRRKRLLRYYYIDMKRAVERPDAMEDAIVSASISAAGDKVAVTGEGPRRNVIIMRMQADEVAAGMFPLRLVYSAERQVQGGMAARIREDRPRRLGSLRPESPLPDRRLPGTGHPPDQGRHEGSRLRGLRECEHQRRRPDRVRVAHRLLCRRPRL